MVEQAREVFVLADASKLGRADSHWWTPLGRPWTLVTDSGADPERLAEFTSRPEVTVTVAAG
jgi:DeoR/GlpR family transcriptional regulator of sugar metabolism